MSNSAIESNLEPVKSFLDIAKEAFSLDKIYFQSAATPVMERITAFHNTLLIIITFIALFVLVLLIFTCYRFSAKRNPIPSKTSHHLKLEIVWTLIPIVILVFIAVPSIKLLYYMDTTPKSEMTLKVVGHQWYWSYEYPDHNNLTFDSNMKKDADLKEGDPRLLSVDNEILLPVGKNIKILITSSDVIHAWAVPAFGVKRDAIPGRINEVWINIKKPGVYYGQCSELCGVLHGFMPIKVRAVSPEEFEKWVNSGSAATNKIK